MTLSDPVTLACQAPQAERPFATAPRLVSRRFSGALLAAAVLAICCGAALIARHLHHAPRPIPTAWFAPVDFAAVHGLAASSDLAEVSP